MPVSGVHITQLNGARCLASGFDVQWLVAVGTAWHRRGQSDPDGGQPLGTGERSDCETMIHGDGTAHMQKLGSVVH